MHCMHACTACRALTQEAGVGAFLRVVAAGCQAGYCLLALTAQGLHLVPCKVSIHLQLYQYSNVGIGKQDWSASALVDGHVAGGCLLYSGHPPAPTQKIYPNACVHQLVHLRRDPSSQLRSPLRRHYGPQCATDASTDTCAAQSLWTGQRLSCI